MKIGPYTLTALRVQQFSLDGGAMFGVVPKSFWEQAAPADALNRVRLSAALLLISGPGRNILVDTGMGSAWPEKLRSIYAVSPFLLDEELARTGLSRTDITDVILTHLHFDHIAGAFRSCGENLVPLFPDARFHIQEENLRTARNPNRKERASYEPRFVDAFQQHCRINLLDGAQELFEGISLIPSHGHTRGQQLVKVSGSEGTLVHCADLVPSAAHIPLPWVTGYDIHPLVVLEEKEALLEEAVEGGWTLCFGHDPFHDAATLCRTGKGIAAECFVTL
ncbi:MBL fold metallo-hydrolase [Pelodictyon luteolum]|uniref:Putative metal-dependent hydrolase n=1 Tax=Chlorobium luteolum (strain DSM 273 / BCRC 81028 / 2530) TaxID=319225 RepID=Q3B499_CHLL3|nr:MBL fold metallo-hydrolase [Pelodictyon luteolum]ABB23832.1 putative metal-dependent hydrolase [Pelodictyon luteolum DSM 273]